MTQIAPKTDPKKVYTGWVYTEDDFYDSVKEGQKVPIKYDPEYPTISPSWLADWDRLMVFFDYPPAIRRVIYTTNAIESLNYTLRKRLKTRGVFPNDESLVKVVYLALQQVAKKWTRPIRDWKAALNQFVILFGERVPV